MLRLRDIMTTDALTVSPETTVREAMELLARHHVSDAPVVSGGTRAHSSPTCGTTPAPKSLAVSRIRRLQSGTCSRSMIATTSSVNGATAMDDAGETMRRTSKTQRAYTRELPGGGFVAIDVTSVGSLFHRRHYHGTLMVERRAGWRREGHSPPVIGEASGATVESVVQQLLPAAEWNPAIGAALMHR